MTGKIEIGRKLSSIFRGSFLCKRRLLLSSIEIGFRFYRQMKYFSKELAMTGAANLIILAGILSIPVALEVTPFLYILYIF